MGSYGLMAVGREMPPRDPSRGLGLYDCREGGNAGRGTAIRSLTPWGYDLLESCRWTRTENIKRSRWLYELARENRREAKAYIAGGSAPLIVSSRVPHTLAVVKIYNCRAQGNLRMVRCSFARKKQPACASLPPLSLQLARLAANRCTTGIAIRCSALRL